MKKIFAMLAVAFAAVFSMTSCATQEQKDAIAMVQAIANQDAQTVANLASGLYAKKDQLNADLGYTLVAGLNYLANAAGDDQATALGYASQVVEVYDLIAGKDAAGLAEATKAGTVDFAPVVEQYKAALAAVQAQAEAAEEAEEGEEAAEEE